MIEEIEFTKSVFNKAGFPKPNIPEIALSGRSNVGKSTFINSLFSRKNIAKTSSAPGKTRSVNFYLVNKLFYLVDLPGYGFAKVSKEERNSWNKLINDYFSGGRKIKLVIHFIDSRHKPTATDIELNNYLKELSFPYIVILNKIDKLKQSELSVLNREVCNIFHEVVPGENLFYYSAVKGTGRIAVQKKIKSLFKETLQ
jgi:GTP-binding protein